MDNWPEWLKLTLTVVLILIILGFILWRLSPIIFFNRKALQAEGRISNWMRVKENNKVYYYPLIEYMTTENDLITYRAAERCEGKPMYPVGTIVNVRYLAKNPKEPKTEYPS